MFCMTCNKETTNPKFCSKSCAATYNNKMIGYRGVKIARSCLICGKSIKKERKYCVDCNKSLLRVDFSKKKLSDLSHLSTYQKHSKIRGYAKYYYKFTGVCSVCGYNLHTELCHIKPISSYGCDAVLSDINHSSNLVELCPNCHWEFDNGLITLTS